MIGGGVHIDHSSSDEISTMKGVESSDLNSSGLKTFSHSIGDSDGSEDGDRRS